MEVYVFVFNVALAFPLVNFKHGHCHSPGNELKYKIGVRGLSLFFSNWLIGN